MWIEALLASVSMDSIYCELVVDIFLRMPNSLTRSIVRGVRVTVW